MKSKIKYSQAQTIVLVLLRLIVGYHFLFEGVDKLFSPNWTSSGFLLQSNWWFSGVFQFIAESPLLLSAVDLINVWGQIFIGIALIVGLFSTTAALLGALMLFMYYIAIPPFIESYIFIDKNLLELFAFLIIALFPTSCFIGVDMLVKKYRSKSNG
ncbi:MAG: DoxX family protein [Melioribacteraceae bacterium]|nr:DoxX family protein [Melioribacteraceae bacterium]